MEIISTSTAAGFSAAAANAVQGTLESIWPILLVGIGLSLAFVVANKLVALVKNSAGRSRNS